MNYLSFFKLKSIDDKETQKSIIEFESSSEIKLPIIFKTFFETYETDFNDLGNALVCLDEINNYKTPFYNGQFAGREDSEVVLYNLFKLSDIIKNMKAVYPLNDEIWQMEMIPIGECAFQSYLMVGVGKENQDKIYIENVTEKERVVYLSENIFEFFKNYIIEADESYLPNGASFSKLYKNWGEDFWRVR